jgi:alkanesulfonate monooxygenase SsuD/methylene tetrahydromethanopterin reductase-like flavin-dependent oxidoreductase (luciferase family)
MLTDDKSEADRFIEMIGPGTVAGSASYIIDRVGELIDAGADEIMFGRLPNDPEVVQRFEEAVVAAFD